MKELKAKHFTNGSVYALRLEDGMPVEVTDTFLPYYTKDAANQGSNALQDTTVGDRTERWMVGVSTQSGCPVGCKFCATGNMKGFRNLNMEEIVEQVSFVLSKNCFPHGTFFDPRGSAEFKINYTRMGEPFLNIDAVKQAIDYITYCFPNTHHFVSTIGLQGTDFSWIKGNITLQISLHSLDEKRRHELIPINNLMSIEELGQIRTNSNLKTTVNLTLVDEADFDIELLKKYFDPEFFFIKLSPINENAVSDSNDMGGGIIEANNLV
jgi:adenine C2-methylase RlmN of 23S rRNA A2503 and tRNA A37